MSKKLLFLISFVLVLAIAGSASAQPETWPAAYWSGFGDGNSWDDANNWWMVDVYWDEVNYPTVPGRIWAKTPNAVPDINTTVHVGQGNGWDEYPAALSPNNAIGYPVIDGGLDAECYTIFISTGPNDTNGPGRLDVNDGNLFAIVYDEDWDSMVIGAVADGCGVVNLSSGSIICGNYDGEGGYLCVGGVNWWDFDAGGGIGTLNITGGTFSCWHMDVPHSDGPDDGTMIGYINLYGGTFYTTADYDWHEFWMGDPGTWPESRIDITYGKAIITSHDELELDAINGWIDEGKITAFGGVAPRAELYRDYDITNAGKTTLQAIATELGQAWQPRPLPGAGVNYRPTLTWTPGDYVQAVNEHIVYFSTSWADVNNGTAPNTPRDVNSFNVGTFVGTLDWTTNYYWRVDEVNDACAPNLWKGLVWDFKTDDHLSVDDVDSYGPDPALRNVWKDYYTGTEPKNRAELFVEFVDPALARSGQSMRFCFKNLRIGGSFVGSEAEASTADLKIGSDWVGGGVEALVLYFYGDPTNLDDSAGVIGGIHQDQMYVAVETTPGSYVVSEYPDMNHIKEAEWHEWNIDLKDFSDGGITLSNVTKMYIGFGGTKIGQTKPSVSGDTVWFDDIRLYPPRCRPDVLKPACDLTDDCITDYQDIDILARDWLDTDGMVSPSAPLTDPNRLVRYTFDTEGGSGFTAINTDTTFGSAADGTLADPNTPTWVTPGAPHPDVCDPNWAVEFQGLVDWKMGIVMNSDFNSIVPGGFTTNTLTITSWIKRAGDQSYWTGLVFSTRDDGSSFEGSVVHAGLSLGDNADWEIAGEIQPPAQNHLAYHWDNCPDEEDATPDGELEVGWWWRSGLEVPNDVWTFCAVTVEPEKATMYMSDGTTLYSAINYETHVPTTLENPFYIGRDPRGWDPWPETTDNRVFRGQIDDVQIYDYTLSKGQISWLAGVTDEVYDPLISPANLDPKVGDEGVYNPANVDIVDFRDYVVMANDWLVEKLWPLRP